MRKISIIESMTVKAKAFFMVALVAVFAIGCSDDDDNGGGNDPDPMLDNIVEIASENNNLSSLVTALTKFPDLVQVLSSSGTNTVFAPTNEAFSALLTAIGQTSIDNVPESVLKRVLQYHVVTSGALKAEDLEAGDVATALSADDKVTIDLSDGVKINGATVTAADVEASNGIVHVINQVLVPALELSILNTVVEPAYFNKDFTTLTSAVVKADLLSTLIDKEAMYTVFAPTNDAFTAAGVDVDAASKEALIPILQYHVIGSVVKKDNLSTGTSAGTLNGDIYISLNDDGAFINGTTEITATDIEADNGVVHVISRTLMPASMNVVEIAQGNNDFSTLVAALSRVQENSDDNLVDILSNAEGNYTVFAPTNAAFQAYLDANSFSELDDIPVEALSKVLKFHVINGTRAFSTDIPNLTSAVETFAGSTFTVSFDGLNIKNQNDAVVAGLNADLLNLLGTNGVIHVVDKVMNPDAMVAGPASN